MFSTLFWDAACCIRGSISSEKIGGGGQLWCVGDSVSQRIGGMVVRRGISRWER